MPNVAFLGVCDRASPVQYGPFTAQNILGLRENVFSILFPLSIADWKFVFAIFDPQHISNPTVVRLVAPDGSVPLTFTVTLLLVSQATPAPAAAAPAPAPILIRREQPQWVVVTSTVNPPAMISEPALYRVVLDSGEQIGVIEFHLVDPPPLTPDRVSAIKADPRAAKAIRLRFECNDCKDHIDTYAALERNEQKENKEGTWYSDLPDDFTCRCGKARVDLKTIRRNLHGFLGAHPADISNMSIVPLYERSAIDTVFVEFQSLVHGDHDEEVIQQYIASHPILLAPFHPRWIRYKTSILADYKTDITLVTGTGKLLLIELERADKRLLTKKGDETAHLQHALRQVRDWLYHVENHRLAVVEGLGLERSDVLTIETLIIMGRDEGHDPKRLRWLKSSDHGGHVEVWTYDDLLHAFDALTRSIRSV